jgi:hypothetical protein
MGTWERGNFLVKTQQLMTNHWEILLIVREGNQKNTNVREFFGKKLCNGKESLRLSGAKKLRLQSKSLSLSKGSASDLLPHN